MLKKFTNKKGFTLMEMLIVVAIIAVLVAIAIPTFASQLNKARVSVDEANIRSGYADVMLKILTAEKDSDIKDTYYLLKDGTVTAVAPTGDTYYKTKGEAKGSTYDIGGINVTGWEKTQTVKYTVANSKVTAITAP